MIAASGNIFFSLSQFLCEVIEWLKHMHRTQPKIWISWLNGNNICFWLCTDSFRNWSDEKMHFYWTKLNASHGCDQARERFELKRFMKWIQLQRDTLNDSLLNRYNRIKFVLLSTLRSGKLQLLKPEKNINKWRCHIQGTQSLLYSFSFTLSKV